MAKIDLQPDEYVVMENDNFTIKSIPFGAILTNRRLVLIDKRKNAKPQRNIPLSVIHNIEYGENQDKEQTVTLSILTKSGNIRQVVLTLSPAEFLHLSQKDNSSDIRPLADAFSVPADDDRKWEYEEWVTKLKEHTVYGIQQFNPESPPPDDIPKPLPVMKIAAIILIIVAIIGIVIVIGQITKGKTQPSPNIVTTSVMTTVETTIPTPVPTPTLVPKPQYIIPSNGTWVRIVYPGNFVGYISTHGLVTPVNNSFEQFIQLSTSDGIITGSIEKQDGSAGNLTIGIYKDGVLVFSKMTRKPLGEIDFQYKL